jgi:acetolactate synthase-1/3 small subunit
VAETLDPQISHITLVTTGDEMIMEQIVKQLNKLVNVIKVIDFREVKFVDREMALIKVKGEASTRAEALRIVDIFRGKVVDVSPNFFTIEVTGDEGKIQAILDLLNQLGLVEVVRTGKVAIARSRKNSTKK